MHGADYCLYTTDFQTRFRAPIPTNTHSVIFNFSPEERKNVLDISSTFNNGVSNFQKSIMSSIYAAERKQCAKFCIPIVFRMLCNKKTI